MIVAIYSSGNNSTAEAKFREILASSDHTVKLARRDIVAFNKTQRETFDVAIVDLAISGSDVVVETLEKWGVKVMPIDASPATGQDASQPPSIHEMTVKQLRAYAGEHSIRLPAEVNIKEEIIAHIEQHLG